MLVIYFKLGITKFSVKDVNLDTIIDTLWWYKIWQHSGYNHTHVNKNFSGNAEEVATVLGANEETKSHLH